MPRPPKKGLAYFPKDVDFYQDEKIVELGMKYGPLGLTIYDVLLTLIYRPTAKGRNADRSYSRGKLVQENGNESHRP